jgi:hypothetical protein
MAALGNQQHAASSIAVLKSRVVQQVCSTSWILKQVLTVQFLGSQPVAACRHHLMEWGTNKEQQQLSKALPVQAWRPKKVPFLTGATMVDCSETHGLAATRDGRVFWWPHSAVHMQGTPAEAAAFEVRSADAHPCVLFAVSSSVCYGVARIEAAWST